MATRAERNNNPGNLRPGVGVIIWKGQTGTDADGFAVFDSREAGIRAADLNLQSYGKRGLDSVSEIIGSWSATDKVAYTTAVAQGLNVNPNAKLDVSNPQVRQSILAQIFNFESGTNRYDAGVLSNSWSDIMTAVNSGNPIDVISSVGGAISDNATNVVVGAIDGLNNVGGSIDNWLSDLIGSGIKAYVIPIALGLGALLLILVSSWGLVKDTPVGTVAKTGAKLATI